LKFRSTGYEARVSIIEVKSMRFSASARPRPRATLAKSAFLLF